MKKYYIDLSYNSGPGIIAKANTGVIYCNQTAGYSTKQDECEGFYYPIQEDPLNLNLHLELIDYFTGPKWEGWCIKEIDEETANFIDALLIKKSSTCMFRVDREKLNESYEAWIHIKLIDEFKELDVHNILPENCPMYGILTWENSD